MLVFGLLVALKFAVHTWVQIHFKNRLMNEFIKWVVIVIVVLLVKASYKYYNAINNLHKNGLINNNKRKWLMLISFLIPLVGLIIISYYSYKEGAYSK